MRTSIVLCLALVAGCNSGAPLVVGGDDLSTVPDGGDTGAADAAVGVDLAIPPTIDMASPTYYDFALPPADLTAPPSDMAASNTPALALRFGTPPYTVNAGQPFSIQVNVVDAATGVPVPDAHPVISVKLGAATNPAGVLTGAVDRLPTNGTALFDGLVLDRWGQYTLIATAPGVASGESMPVRAQGTQVAFLVQPSTAVAHQVMTPPPKIALEDPYGDVDLLANGSVNATVVTPANCTGGSYYYPYATMVNGVASFTNIVIDKACSGYKLQLLNSTTQQSQPFDVVFGAPVGLQLGPVTLPVRGAPFDLPVAIVDAGGNLVPSAAPAVVTLSLPAGVSWSGPTTTTTASGVGAFAGMVVDATGTITATATASGLTTATYQLYLTAWELRGTQSPYPSRLYVHPKSSDVLYLIGSGGISRSTDGGKTFNQIFTSSVFDLAFDPSAPSTMYATTSTGIIKSSDGISFGFVPLRSDYYLAVAVDPSASGNVWVATNKDVWRSSDGGSTWTGVTPALASSIYALAIDRSGIVYAGGDTVRHTSDSGATWTSGVGLPSGGWNSITVDPLTAGRLYTCTSTSSCYYSSDSGSTWLSLGHGSPRIVVDPNTANTLYASNGYNGMYKSRDGGVTWVQLPFPAYNFFDLAAAPSSTGELYALGNSYAIYRTLSGGE